MNVKNTIIKTTDPYGGTWEISGLQLFFNLSNKLMEQENKSKKSNSFSNLFEVLKQAKDQPSKFSRIQNQALKKLNTKEKILKYVNTLTPREFKEIAIQHKMTRLEFEKWVEGEQFFEIVETYSYG